MFLGVVVCIWKRHALAALVLRRLTAIREELRPEGIDLLITAVVSESEDPGSTRLAQEAHVICVDCKNDPRPERHHAGLAVLRSLRVDGVVGTGSDDILDANLFRAWAKALADGIDIAGVTDVYTIKSPDMSGAHWHGYPEHDPHHENGGGTIGTGRLLSRRLLDALDWRPWQGAGSVGLDYQLMKNIRDAAGGSFAARRLSVTMAEIDTVILDVKSDREVDIGRFESAAGEDSTPIDADDILRRFPEPEADALRELLDPLAGYLGRTRGEPEKAPLVSLVMIARDAEKTILRAIRPCLPFVDEVVCVVDSRTTDGTIERLKQVDATAVVEDWRGFAWARNRAAECARGRWHLLIDADEAVELGDFRATLEAAEEKDADAIRGIVLGESIVGQKTPMRQARVVRAGRTRWIFRRHNELRGAKRYLDVDDLRVRNSYIGRERTIADAAIPDLLTMYQHPSEPGVEPEEEKAHAALYLGRTYLGVHDWENARAWARVCRTHVKDTELRAVMSAIVEGWATFLLDGMDRAEEFLRPWIERVGDPGVAEFHYLVGSFHMMKCLLAATAPGQYAGIQQGCLAHVPAFPRAFSLMGFPFEVKFEAGPAAEMPV